MTTKVFIFVLAALCVCVTTSVGQYQECKERRKDEPYYYFSNCIVSNFSNHLPIPSDLVSIQLNNVSVVDMGGCVRWLGDIKRLTSLSLSGNDSSFLDCLAKFNRSLPLTRTSNYEASLFIASTDLPLDDWIAVMFKILFGNAKFWETIGISYAPLVTRVPKAFGNQGFLNLSTLVVMNTGVSAIREHDFDGYHFFKVGEYVDPGVYLHSNRICVVELAAFRNVPFVHMFGNPIDENGDIDWKELANRYPNATAFATNPVCADELNTAWDCYRVIDTSYSGIAIVQRGCDYPTTTAEQLSTQRTSKAPAPTTSQTSTDTPLKSFVYEAVKFVKFVKVKILGGKEAEALKQSKSLFDSDSEEGMNA